MAARRQVKGRGGPSAAARLHGCRVAIALACLAILHPAPSRAQDNCDALLGTFNAAMSGADLPRIVNAARQMRDSVCPAQIRGEVRRKAALAHLREAGRTHGLSDAAALQLLEAGAQFDQPWQLMVAIGDLRDKLPGANGKPDRGAASLAYQAALADIANTTTVPQPPPKQVVERIVRLAQQTRAAATQFVRGDILMAREIRKIEIQEVSVPVEFVRDSDALTERGRQAGEDTARVLADRNRPRILLIGHTDPDGTDAYNLELSKRRAQAFRQFLVERGYPAGNIETTGYGKSRPRRIENASNYTKDELYQMQRRVEVQFR